MGFFDKLKNVARSVAKTTETVGTHIYRKAKKPLGAYRAPERAQKVLEQQKKIPRRAPMNVPKIHFSKEKIEANKEKVKEILKKSDELLKNLEKIKVVSHDPPGSKITQSSHPKPQSRIQHDVDKTYQEVPRGLLTLDDAIELLHNRSLDREQWTAQELSERFRLREADVEDLIKYFNLLEINDKKLQKPDEPP